VQEPLHRRHADVLLALHDEFREVDAQDSVDLRMENKFISRSDLSRMAD
jgi:hypothetical protein